MNGLEGLPTDILRMVFGLLDANTLQLVSQVSSHLHEQATTPEVWKERLPEVVGEGQWGRISARFLELLRLRRFSKVVNFAFSVSRPAPAGLDVCLAAPCEHTQCWPCGNKPCWGQLGHSCHRELRDHLGTEITLSRNLGRS